jgi:hypothetical protein
MHGSRDENTVDPSTRCCCWCCPPRLLGFNQGCPLSTAHLTTNMQLWQGLHAAHLDHLLPLLCSQGHIHLQQQTYCCLKHSRRQVSLLLHREWCRRTSTKGMLLVLSMWRTRSVSARTLELAVTEVTYSTTLLDIKGCSRWLW